MKKVAKSSHEMTIDGALAALRKAGSKSAREGLARFGIVTADEVLGVGMSEIQRIGKACGKDHSLALALWDSGIYEARLLSAFVADPERLTSAQMDRFCKQFDNWATCDTLCFHLFDRVPHAWAKVRKWSTAREEFVKRSAFALLASIAGHDKLAVDARFLEALPLIEAAASDERNFVKKAVSWALRRIGRRSLALNQACLELAERLVAATGAPKRWIGRDARKELQSPAVQRAVSKKQVASGRGSTRRGA